MKPGTIISHYEVLSLVGGGGMGIVYKARDTKLDRFVALKFLPPELSTDPDANERFIVEAKAASALDHNNICTIYEIGETDDGRLFIAMPFYDGETLKHRLQATERRSGLRVEPGETLSIARQIAEGLMAAHEKGIIHRDVKPANIMLTEKGRAVILDFGLAKLPGILSLTKTGSTIGTAAYMAPEQIRGEAIDARTDLWSLGVVFYELLTGCRPFEGDYEQALSYAILNQDVSEPEQVSADVSAIAMKLLAKDPAGRYAHAEALIKDLDVALEARQIPTSRRGNASGATTPGRESGQALVVGAPNTGRRNTFIGTAAAVVIAAIALIFFLSPGGDVANDDIDEYTVAIMPFSVLGDPELEYLANGMVDLLSMRLDGVGELKTADPNALLGLIAQEELAMSGPEEALALANRLGAGRAIMGTVIRMGDEIQINATLYSDPSTPELEVTAIAPDEEAMSGSIDELAREFVFELIGFGEETGQSLASVTSSNYTALKYLLKAADIFRTGDYESAIDPLENAIAEDSSFALAWGLLSQATGWLGREEEEAVAFGRAFALRASLPERARSLFEAGYIQFVVGDVERAMNVYRTILASYPYDLNAIWFMGEMLFHYNPFLGKRQAEAREYFERSSSFGLYQAGSLIHLAEIARGNGRYAEAESLGSRLVALSGREAAGEFQSHMEGLRHRAEGDSSWRYAGPGGLNFFEVVKLWRSAAMIFEDFDAARQIATVSSRYDAYPTEIRARASLWTGYSAIAQGRLREYGEIVNEVGPAFSGRGIVERALLFAFPAYPATDDLISAVRADVAEWDTLTAPLNSPTGQNLHTGEYEVIKIYLDALLALRSGDTLALSDGKRRLAARADSTSGSDLAFSTLRTVEAIEAWYASDWEEVVKAIDEARLRIPWRKATSSRIREQTLNRFVKAEALYRLGDLETALDHYYSVLATDEVGGLLYVGPTYIRVAEIHERLGDQQKAIEYYTRLVRAWKNSDPELIPIRDEAQRNLDRLLAESVREPSP